MKGKNTGDKERRKGGKKTLRRGAKKPHRPKKKGDGIFGFMKGRMQIVGDIVLPMPDWKYWEPAECLEEK